LQIMAQKGRTVVVGNRGSIEINPRLMMVKESVVMGCTLFGTNSVRVSILYYLLYYCITLLLTLKSHASL